MSTETPGTIPIEFTGKTSEYFSIWIVNLLLTIVTLGFYYPWAKVRNKRYLYTNTRLDNACFDFHGDPIAILKGFLLATGIFVVYYMVSNYFPLLSIMFMVLLFIFLPWLIIRSVAFRLRNTSYRNLRFNFSGEYGEAAGIYIGLALLNPFTLGFLTPHMIFRQKEFLFTKSSFGKSPFKFKATSGGFYKIYGMVILVLFLGIMAAMVVPAFQAYTKAASEETSIQQSSTQNTGSGQRLDEKKVNKLRAQFNADENAPVGGRQTVDQGESDMKPGIQLMAVIPMVLTSLLYLLVFAYIQAATGNLIWNNVEIGGHKFSSSLKTFRMMWLYLSNALLIILSLGLLIPWAKIRMIRYRMEQLKMIPGGDMDSFVADERQKVTAAGEELGEIFDVDVGIGI